MDYESVSKQILEKVGGSKNITSAEHCMTRLRLILADESKFGVESNVRFADFKDAKVITTAAPDGEWKKQKNIIQVQ